MFVREFFTLHEDTCEEIYSMKPDFGYDGFGEFLFYRTYSREKSDGKNESWADVVIRVINGVFSIRKDWYKRNYIPWNEDFWQNLAKNMAISMFKMEWLPPGRGLWMMGTSFMYERGSMALYNCAFTYLTSDDFGDDIAWLMDSLMLGVGVGFEPTADPMQVYQPKGQFHHIVQDSREGWANSTRILVEAFTRPNSRFPQLNYSQVRGANQKIKGFGGVSSGPDPLIRFHKFIEEAFRKHIVSPQNYPIFRLKADIANMTGVCVVAGNVRRSAELMMGDVTNQTFLNLKDYEINPDREEYGWMSNNTAKFFTDDHFEMLGEVAKRVTVRGEPGVANLRNFSHGRIGKKDRTRYDRARGLNPCGEITLEHRETCNVVETLPTRCATVRQWYAACEYATIYASTVSLLPTHQESTNRVVAKNRRIGVSIIDYTGWRIAESQHRVIKYMRKGYEIITNVNRDLNAEAGIPEAIKKTTIKPGGTIPRVAGRTPGIGYPTFNHTLRRVRVARNSPVSPILMEAGLRWEPEKYDPNTLVFEWPILQGPAKPATQATLWEQAFNLITVQSEWADNAVSNTLYFRPKWELIADLFNPTMEQVLKEFYQSTELIEHMKEIEKFLSPDLPKYQNKYNKVVTTWKDGKLTRALIFQFDGEHEEDDIEAVLSSTVPKIKSLSLAPHMNPAVYDQAPEEGIDPEHYKALKKHLHEIDWSQLTGNEAVGEKYCEGPNCEVIR